LEAGFALVMFKKPDIFKFLRSMGKKKASKNCFFKACFFFWPEDQPD